MQPSDYRRTFRQNGEIFRVIGINPSRPKYPISAERVSNGRGYKFTADIVTLRLQAEEKNRKNYLYNNATLRYKFYLHIGECVNLKLLLILHRKTPNQEIP